MGASNGEPPIVLYYFGKQDLQDNEDETDSTPSMVYKSLPSINDFPAGDMLAPKLLGEQPVPSQGILHEHVDLGNLEIARHGKHL